MDAETLVLAVLDAVPDRQVQGRKRLQKLSYFAVRTGAPADAHFFLHDYGPFSTDVAAATDLLAFLGDISEQEIQIGPAKRYSKLYRLSDPSSVPERLPSNSVEALKILDRYSTIDLEIASTISYFMSKGMSRTKAIEETKKLKPSKSQPKIIQRAQEALSKVGLDERGRTDQMSGS
jgi:uncharacterized protein